MSGRPAIEAKIDTGSFVATLHEQLSVRDHEPYSKLLGVEAAEGCPGTESRRRDRPTADAAVTAEVTPEG